jgi:hypothetical protein
VVELDDLDGRQVADRLRREALHRRRPARVRRDDRSIRDPRPSSLSISCGFSRVIPVVPTAGVHGVRDPQRMSSIATSV